MVGGTITDGGLYACVGTGSVFGFYTTSQYFTLFEIALFNVPPIQAASTVTTTTSSV